jgi:hypothetical protein
MTLQDRKLVDDVLFDQDRGKFVCGAGTEVEQTIFKILNRVRREKEEYYKDTRPTRSVRICSEVDVK